MVQAAVFYSVGLPDRCDLPAGGKPTKNKRSSEDRPQGKLAHVVFRFHFSNPSAKLAFFLNPSIRRLGSDEEILPSYWSENYFSILPGGTRQVLVQVQSSGLANKGVFLRVEGWNLVSFDIKLED